MQQSQITISKKGLSIFSIPKDPGAGEIFRCTQCGEYIEASRVDSIRGHGRSEADEDGDECEVHCGPVEKFVHESKIQSLEFEITRLRAELGEAKEDARAELNAAWEKLLGNAKVETLDALSRLMQAKISATKECARLIDLWWKNWLKLQPNPAYYREVDRIVSFWPEKLIATSSPPPAGIGREEA